MSEIAVMAGDILTLKGWSNATATLRAIVNFRPAEWYKRFYLGLAASQVAANDAHSIVFEVALASSRAQGTANFTVTEDGTIDDAVINYSSATALTRGQTYAQLLLQRSGTTLSATSVLAAGYVYGGNTNGGHLPSLNHIVEAGPVGGQGTFRDLNSADPPAGSEIATQGVPIGAIWRILTMSVNLVQGITQSPQPNLRIRNGGSNIIAKIPVTTTALGASSTAQLTWGIGLVQSSFAAVIGDETHTAPLPNIILQANADFATVTDGIGANTDYGAMSYEVEEWVIPN